MNANGQKMDFALMILLLSVMRYVCLWKANKVDEYMSIEIEPRGFFYSAMLSFIELGLFLIVILFLYLVFKKWGVIT